MTIDTSDLTTRQVAYDPQGLLDQLAHWGIPAATIDHEPYFTVEQAKKGRGLMPGGHIKNLFMRDKKRQFWLVTAAEDRAIDLKRLAQDLGAGRFSFGSPESLKELLGVEPGSVTPLGLINDRAGQVRFVLDAALTKNDVIHCHPLINSMTTSLSPGGLMQFLRQTGHEPLLHDFDRHRDHG